LINIFEYQKKMYNISPNTLFIGQKVDFLPVCHSTNDVMAEKLSLGENLPEGAVILTAHQTAGRGQRGNSWESQPGRNLTFSLLLRPVFLKASDQFYLNMALALGVQKGLQSLLDLPLFLKWPNDLYACERKLGGMLIENTVRQQWLQASVAGIGINVNQEVFEQGRPISLCQLTGKFFVLEKVLTHVLESLEAHYLLLREGKTQLLITQYLGQLYRFGEWHLFTDADSLGFEGRIVGVSPSGRLQVETRTQTREFDFKAIRFADQP
jgi:BirA family biotin operon repressor/biotin-[acetyl-CoA-carboxylase] ligase